MTCGEAVKLLQEKQIDQMPILTDTGYLYPVHVLVCAMLVLHVCYIDNFPQTVHSDVLGMLTMANLTSKLVHGQAKTSDPVSMVAHRQFHKVCCT